MFSKTIQQHILNYVKQQAQLQSNSQVAHYGRLLAAALASQQIHLKKFHSPPTQQIKLTISIMIAHYGYYPQNGIVLNSDFTKNITTSTAYRNFVKNLKLAPKHEENPSICFIC